MVVNRIWSKLEINYTPTYIFIEEVEYLKPHAETSWNEAQDLQDMTFKIKSKIVVSFLSRI